MPKPREFLVSEGFDHGECVVDWLTHVNKKTTHPPGAAQVSSAYAYDALDRLVKTTNADGTVSTLAYGLATSDADILQVTSTDKTSHVQKFTLDAHGKLTKRVKLNGATALTTSYTRDVLGRIIGVVDPKLNTWAYSYDGLGRRIAVNDPDLGSWTYAYDAASKLVSRQDAKGPSDSAQL